jgi:CDP-glucose 4,6-dehydratase
MKPEFWRGRRVFVTGHTGFKGSWLCLWLQELGAKVTGYALAPSTQPNMFELCNVAEGMDSVSGDIRDLPRLQRTMKEAEPEVVFHLAAQPLVRASYQEPVETFHINVMGAVNLLDAVRQTKGIRSLVVITSDKCYENREWFWSYREKSSLGGADPYSSSKACVELVFAAYRKSFFNPDQYQEHGLALATARAGNVIGGGDWSTDRLVPDILDSLMANRPVEIRSPHAIRPWQHVLEPLHGYLSVAEHLYNDGLPFGGSWNFGPFESSEKTVSWMVNHLYNCWGTDMKWHHDTRRHPHENTYLKLDSSKARTLLGWAPELDLETTLEWIVEWTRKFQESVDMRAVTMKQIRRFAHLVRAVSSTASYLVAEDFVDLLVVGCAFH